MRLTLALLLSGCAVGEAEVACARLCDRFSTIPVMSVSVPVDSRTCRCAAFPGKLEKDVYPNGPFNATVRCSPDCATLARRMAAHQRFEVEVHQ